MRPLRISAGLLAPVLWGLSFATAFAADGTTVSPPLAAGQEAQWKLVEGTWRMAEGVFEQESPDRLSAAILKEPSFTDFTVTAEFNIKAVGKGVRAAAIILRATGTLSYYWLHIDSKFRQLILVRSTPGNTWIEVTRRGNVNLANDEWHTAKVECRGTRITASIDGTEILSAEDKEIAAGRIGLGTSQGRVQYRNLKIEGNTQERSEPLKNESPPFRVISRGTAAGSYQAFPDACRLRNGDILVVFYGGYGHVSFPNAEYPKGGRVCMVRSSDEGRTWTPPAVLFDDEVDNRDPHIAQLRDGALLCSFFRYWQQEGKTLFVSCITISTDGGKTWETKAQEVTPKGWAVSAPVRELSDGTLLLGVYTEEAGLAWGGVVRSTDHGKTWSAPVDIGKESKQYLDAETDVLERKDGSIYAALRSSKVNMHCAVSSDKGLTWSPVKDLGFQGHAPHLNRLSSGEVLLVHRVPQTALHVSRDDCESWKGPYILDTVGGAYPATVELKDHTVLAIYYEEGEGSAIRALRFRLKPDGIEPLSLE